MTACEWACLVNTTVTVLSAVKDRALGLQSPYGRYSNARPSRSAEPRFELRADLPVPARLAWFLMEAPNLVLGGAVAAAAAASGRGDAHAWIVVGMFMLHYAARTLVYSALIRGGKPMPLLILALGATFTAVNGFVQTYHHLFDVQPSPVPRQGFWGIVWVAARIVGFAVFAFGMFLNHYADHVLRTLRKSDEDRAYYIPRGPFFDVLVAPNLVGEIVEWLGYAVFANTYVAWGFAVSTAFTVGNRALGHKAFYVDKFKDEFPRNRWALVPGVV